MAETSKDDHVEHIALGEAGQDQVIRQLHGMKGHHHWDPNLPDEVAHELEEVLQTTDTKARSDMVHDLLDNFPYPEVRAAVSNIDEGGHSNTIRAWVIGLFFATLGAIFNMVFSLRQPIISIQTYVSQLLAYPVGIAWQKFVPSKEFHFFGIKCNLNPGPFSKKEHTLIVIMSDAAFTVVYATDIILAQRMFYGHRFGWTFEILLTVSTQMLGLGMAGLFAKFLVAPAAMIWPVTLVNTALFNTLHDHSTADPQTTSGWKIGRYRFFMLITLGSFCWYWLPGYIAPFLSVFAWVTWIKPQSPVINQLFGGVTGLSLLPITFDWTQISGFNFSPLISPWFAMANTLLGMVLFIWIVTPAIHYSGMFYSEYLPISDSNSYDNTGNHYNVSRILTPEFGLDEEKYHQYSPLFLSTTFMMAYGLAFGTLLAILVHTVLFHGRDIWHSFRQVGQEPEDIHGRLMARFKPVPLWWYASVTLSMTALGLGVCLGYDTHLSWWAFFVSLLIPLVWWLPVGIVQASTNISIGTNVITEFIIGYMQPGKPMAMMIFKVYGYITLHKGLTFTADLKMGHYMKLPPRVTFTAQMVSCLWTSIVQVAAMNWAIGAIEGICTQHQENHFSCPHGRVFFNASVIWGLIGPQRIFSLGQMYSPLLLFFIPGFLLPIAIYIGARIYPRSPIRYLSAPLILGGANLLPPASPLNYLSWAIVGFIFNKYIRSRFNGWWMTYNYVLSAGLDIGLALSTILIFLALQLKETNFPSWWGTRIASGTMDTTGTAVQTRLPKGEKFGPSSW
ncbi:hypothetical protein N7456_013328 [Penicillium angulare]|uniref:Uncharacterized protein n=1 Tax=Penicillium angulare TaxID=116970 RepID=A0A9W9JTC8_9EURO|nr:hypothetical protein N7456_013328 [Penicillium angulare]